GLAALDGKISRPSLSAGNFVNADTSALATSLSANPLYVFFDVDERTVLRLLRLQREVTRKVNEKIPVLIALADEETWPHQGQVDSQDIRVDPATGTLRWRAVLAN